MAIGNIILLAAIVVLFTTILVVLGLHIYARYFWERRGSFRRSRLAFVGEQDSPRLRGVGLGKSEKEALPVFVYQTENHKDRLESAICLCKFEDNEKGRLLPKCHHSFHINCIDMWFNSHSTCLQCRSSAQPDTPADSVVVLIADEGATSGTASETDEQVPPPTVSESNASTSMEPDLDIDLCPSCRHDKVLRSSTYPSNTLFWPTQKRVSSMSNSAFFYRGTASTSGKTLYKITINIPRRVDSSSSPRLLSSDDQKA